MSDDGWVFTTGVVLKGKSDGTIERSYRRNGFVRPYDPEGREYLATALLRVVRKSGFGAESRVARFLKQGGIEAVFTEIAQLEGDYARRLYYTELLKQAKLSPADLTRVANQAATTISSDYELATLLKAAGKQNVGDENALVALIEATRTLQSDYEHHQALSALVPVKPTAKVASAALASAVNLQSDYERATFLVDFARRGGLTSATKPAFLDLVKRHALVVRAEPGAADRHGRAGRAGGRGRRCPQGVDERRQRLRAPAGADVVHGRDVGLAPGRRRRHRVRGQHSIR